ncbi:PREDICTED: uncharacterized protein LOC105448276 [Wasmannia auropunctata]|uniref:uncharacterized protein LOC105448276 n=1 Tax=Wasmannia auropunctata TaxID=64793 RepID=UPI0005EE3020|nr:PREDICTED: uncharacterized protein LOC105448276 [Wasmannia auropunctata]
MSRDPKASCTDCQGRGASAVPSPSSFPVDATRRDGLNEPERSVRPVSSFVPTTCASDTDEGDYETSSEGMILSKRSGNRIHGARAKESLCVYLKEKSASLSKRAAFDGNVSAIKREVISDSSHELMENRLTRKTTHAHDSLILMPENLAQSKSLPILKSGGIPSGVSMDFTAADVALMSASSSARERKMSMIIKRMAPLISPYPSTVSLTTGATTNFRGRRYETRRLAPRTKLPILCDTTVINDGRSEELVAEVTLHETKNNHRAMNWDPRRDAIPTFVNDEGTANVTNDDVLVDVARNPCSSIKSVYFPPNLSDPLALPYDAGKTKRHPRVSTDVETLMKIDHELSSLRCQYNEIIGKARALGLSGTGFDLDVSCRLDRPDDTFGQSVLSPCTSNYFPNRGQTRLRQACTGISFGAENRSALVDKTAPPSTFSVVGKPTTPRGSRTSWLNENGSTRRQEALSFAVRDPTRAFENFDGPRSSSRIGNSISYFPTTVNSRTFHGENVLDDRSRNGCVSNSNFQPYRKSKTVIEKATSAWDGWYPRDTVTTNPSNVLSRMEYNSHRYRTVEDSRTSTSNSFEIRRRKSSVSIVEVIDNNWSTVEGTANKRSDEHSEILSGNQNSMVVETKFADRGSNYHKSVLTETERVAEDNRIPSSAVALKSIEPVDPDRAVLRTVSASAGVPQIRVVCVNTEFRTIVEKRYTSRAVSPIQHSRLATASSTTTSPSNNVLLAKVSSIFVQQVRADSSGEMAKIMPPTKICSVEANKRDALADAVSKRDFCVQKVDSRLPTAKDPPRLSEFKRDEADLTTTEFRKARYLRLPRAKEKITIVPIVLTDEISESRSANVDFAIPRYAVKTMPKLSHQIAPFDARKFHETSASSIRDNESYRRGIADPVCLNEVFAGEKRWRADRTSVSHVDRHPRAEDYHPPLSVVSNPRRPIRVTTSNARVVGKAGEYHESGRQRVAKAIPGMRSTPEDFLCET